MDGTQWDIGVIGAGPAGALIASRLAARGLAVLLVDKSEFPRPKVCGGCLGAFGLQALHDAGLDLDRLGVASAPLTELSIRSGGAVARLGLSGRRAVGRAEFDAALVDDAVANGARFAPGRRARVGRLDDEGRVVELRSAAGRTTVRARVVVVAAGLGSATVLEPRNAEPVRTRSTRIGAGLVFRGGFDELPVGRITMAAGRRGEGYVGLVRLPDGGVDIAAALDTRFLGSGRDRIGALASQILTDANVPVPDGVANGAWMTSPTLTQAPTRLGAERVLVIGDAGGYVEPFTGEGIGWALRGALEAEPLVVRGVERWDEHTVRLWETRHRATIGWRHRRCRRVCGWVGGTRVSPWVVRLLAHAPWCARPWLRQIDPPEPAPGAINSVKAA